MAERMRSAPLTRRAFIETGAGLGGAAALGVGTLLGAPGIVRAASPLTLDFVTIPDPDGWHPALRLKGDWLIFVISDGVLSGYGEASHSKDDPGCRQRAAELFEQHYRDFPLSLERLAEKEHEIGALDPDFVTQTAFSGLNQALYELLAKREQVPTWQLFRDKAPFEGLPLYTTINRALETRSPEEYLEIVGAVRQQGFRHFKCAPFEAVDTPENGVAKAAAGLEMLERLHDHFPDLGMRVDFHERFLPEDFYELIPRFEALEIEWLEEPFRVGPTYTELKQHTRLRLAGGELFWGRARFQEIAEHAWVDVIMPDVKHVGGFGPLLDVLEMGEGLIEISPHNPSGPISTAASLHAAAVRPRPVKAIEYAFDKLQTRQQTGELIEDGMLLLKDAPGWGVAPAA